MQDDVSRKAQSTFHKITNEGEIKDLLDALLKARGTVHLKAESPPGEPTKMTAVRVYAVQGRVLKGVYITGPNLGVGKKVTAMFENAAVKYFGFATIKNNSENQEYSFVLDALHKLQRRSGFRVIIPKEVMNAEFNTSSVGDEMIIEKVRIADFSIGGAGLIVPVAHADVFKAGKIVSGTLVVGAHPPLSLQMEIRYARQKKDKEVAELHIGCMFMKSNQNFIDRIAYLVNDCHRQIYIRTQRQR